MINNRSSEGNGTDASAVLALYRMGQQNRPDHPYHRSDLTGNPAHAFRSPKVSRATDIASPVFTHHLVALKGSSFVYRTIATCPPPMARQIVFTRREWNFEVIRMSRLPQPLPTCLAITLTSSA